MTSLRGQRALLWSLSILGVGLGLLLALGAMWVVVGMPAPGEPWGTVARWGSLGELLQGLGTMVLAFGAVASVGWALYRYFEQRGRDLALRERQNDLDTVQVQRELTTILRLLYESAADPAEKSILREKLDEAVDTYQALLEGILQRRPELAEARRAAITATLEDLRKNVENLDSARGAGRR